ncbi:UNVERIFIED_CONTAM: tc1a [Trichonephila clavipes]
MRVLEAVDRRAPSNSKNWQWTTEDDISARRPTPASHGDIPGPIFRQENARSHIVKTVRDFCSAQHMQLLPWSAYSPDMLPIEHVWVWLVGVSLVIRVPQLQNIQNLFDCMPRRIAVLIAARGGCTKY